MNRYDSHNLPEYKPLDTYGLIGDCKTAALVNEDGGIDWACLPEFDSSAVFARLLDPKAGHFAVRPKGLFRSRQYYEPGTNVLITDFVTDSGRLRVRDFMPVIAERRSPAGEIHRRVEAVDGRIPIEVIFAPRFDFGSTPHSFESGDYGVIARCDGDSGRALALSSPISLSIDGADARAEFDLDAGSVLWFVLDWDSRSSQPVSAYRSQQRLVLARAYWRRWASQLSYQGSYHDEVQRSLLTLKLLTYASSGAVIAAPTTSLPEWIGGGRNWDYRYTWVRDSAFILRALFSAGYIEEGTLYFDWLLERCVGDDAGVGIMYDVRGSSNMAERELALRGYKDSRPVRVGNGAAGQFQLDIYGSLIDAARRYHLAGGILTMVEMERLAAIVERVRSHWREPDDGIWESRGQRQHYTYSKVWAWVALNCGSWLARDLGLDLPWEQWATEAEEIRQEVLKHSYNEKVGAFTQYYGSDTLDAAVLVMPLTDIIPANDPRFRSTRRVICDQLAAGPYPLLYRYNPELADDGVGGSEGAFLLPSFWLVEGLALSGMHREARATFESLLRHASALGLYSEEVHPKTGQFLGNFPQGFSHLGLVNAALALEQGPYQSKLMSPER